MIGETDHRAVYAPREKPERKVRLRRRWLVAGPTEDADPVASFI